MKLPFTLGRFSWYLIVIAVIVGGCFGLYRFGYNSGVSETTQKYEKIIVEERERVRQANQEALEEARRREQDLKLRLERMDDEIIDLQREATQDPNASRPAVSGDSVRRLNRVR